MNKKYKCVDNRTGEVIFCNTKYDAQEIADFWGARHFKISCIDGDKTDDEKLDEIDLIVIEKYLRRKKLEKIYK